MGFWEMYYRNLEYKHTHPWTYQEIKDDDDEFVEWIVVIFAILFVLGVCGVWFWLACPTLF